MEGELWFEKALTDSIMSARRYSLTRREGQLVSLLSQGPKNKEIATALNISEGTVKVYLSRPVPEAGRERPFRTGTLRAQESGAGRISRATGRKASPQNAPVWQPPRSFLVERIPPKSQPVPAERRALSYKF